MSCLIAAPEGTPLSKRFYWASKDPISFQARRQAAYTPLQKIKAIPGQLMASGQ
jgi:hypothetical protein